MVVLWWNFSLGTSRRRHDVQATPLIWVLATFLTCDVKHLSHRALVIHSPWLDSLFVLYSAISRWLPSLLGARQSWFGSTLQLKGLHLTVNFLFLGVVWRTSCLHYLCFRLQTWGNRMLFVRVLHFRLVESSQRFSRRSWVLAQITCFSVYFHWRFVKNFVTIFPGD